MTQRILTLPLLLSLAVACADSVAEENSGALTLEKGLQADPYFDALTPSGAVDVSFDDQTPIAEEPAPVLAEGTWALSIIEIAEREDSFDLDGDGVTDNALSSFSYEFREAFADWMLETDMVPALSARSLGGEAQEVGLCALEGSIDDIMGQADLFPGADMDDDGYCINAREMDGDAPDFIGDIPATLHLAVELQSVDGWETDGTVYPDRVELWVGGVVPVEKLSHLAQSMGDDQLARDVFSRADFDLNNDGSNDAISVGLLLTGLKVEVN